jgi:hypothetical protein
MTTALTLSEKKCHFGYINVRLLGHESEVESDDSDDGMCQGCVEATDCRVQRDK